MNHTIPISIIIVTYNSSDDIEECVHNIDRDDQTRIVVVDNCSTDDTREILSKLEHDGLIDEVIESASNVGFAQGVNQAMRTVHDGAVFLLNPDAKLDRGTLDALRSADSSHPEVGIFSPVVYSNSNVRTMTAGKQPRIWPLFTHYSGLSRLFPRARALKGRHLFLDKHTDADQFVEWVAGCTMYIPQRTIESIGVLSEKWFMYGEDIEYCKRALDSGYKIMVLSNARAFHAMGSSVNTAPKTINTLWAQNTYRYYCSEFNPTIISKVVWRIIFSAGLTSRAAVWAIQGTLGNEVRRDQARRFFAFSRAVWQT